MMFRKIAQTSFKYPWLILVLAVGLILTAGLGISKLKMELDIYSMKDSQFPATLDLSEMKAKFKDFNTLIFVAEWGQEPTAGLLCQVQQKLYHLADTIPYSFSVSTPFDVRLADFQDGKVVYPKIVGSVCDLPSQMKLGDIAKPLNSFPSIFIKIKDVKSIFVTVSLNENIEKENITRKFHQAMGAWHNSLKEMEPEFQMKWRMVGPASFRYHFQNSLMRDSLINLLLLPFILIFMRVFFGTWRMGLYFLCTAILTIFLLLGFMGHFSFPVDLLTNSLLLMTVIASAADFIFVANKQFNGSNLFESITEVVTPGFFTTLTTALGFAALGLGDYEILRRFGLMAALGAFIEWFLLFVALPSFLVVLKMDCAWAYPSKAKFNRTLAAVSSYSFPRYLTVIFLSFAVGAGYFSNKLNFFDEPLKYFSKEHPISADMTRLHHLFGWVGQLYLLFPDTLAEEKVERCLGDISVMDGVAGVENPYEIKRAFTKNLPNDLQEPVWRTAQYSRYFQNFFQASLVRSQIFLRELNSDSINKVSSEIKKRCEGVSVVGQSEVFREISEKVTRTLWISFLSSIGLIVFTVFALIAYHREKHVFALIFSIVSGPLVCITLMGLFQVPINIITCIFLSVLVGMTGDNAIQFLYAQKGKMKQHELTDGINNQARASLIFSLFLCLGSCFLVFQTLMPVRVLGLLFAAGSIINLAGDLFVLRDLMSWRGAALRGIHKFGRGEK